VKTNIWKNLAMLLPGSDDVNTNKQTRSKKKLHLQRIKALDIFDEFGDFLLAKT